MRSQQRALAATAAAHDHKDLAALHGEAHVALNDVLVESQGKAVDGYGRAHNRTYSPITFSKTAKIASVMMIARIPETTADVAAAPTAAAFRPDSMPRKQPVTATSAPNTAALTMPMLKSPR